MKFKLLGLACLLSAAVLGQPVHTAIVTGSVIDSATGAGMPNYPVFIADSSNAMGGGGSTLTLFTDANGNYADTMSLYSTAGILLAQTEDSCSGNWLYDFYTYTGNTPSVFTFSSTFVICGGTSSGGGGGSGGGTGSGNTGCNAAFTFDSTLTGNGQIVLYNTSTLDSMFQNANVLHQWSWGDGSGAVGAFPSHQYTQSGTFVICLTQTATDSAAFGVMTCTSTYCDTISIDSTGNVSYKGVNVMVNVYSPDQMNLDDEEIDGFKLYPNPSQGAVNFEWNRTSEVTIYTMNGQLLYAGPNDGQTALPLLPAGTYVVRAQSEKHVHQEILIVR
jgi:hypothetical protein